MNFPVLSLMTFFPLLATFAVIATPKDKDTAIKVIALIGTAIPLALSLWIYGVFEFGKAGMQFVERARWIDAINAKYLMGIDGISLPLVIVTTLLTFVCIVASWNISYRVKEYFGFMLFLEVGMIGVFLALDFILFYVFWEIVLIPMYFLIGIWGGPRKEYAAIKFFLYTFIGSVFMLMGILLIYFYSGGHTFEMFELAKAHIPALVLKLAFLGIFLGLAVKVPIVPFHTWLPDAHVEAPTAVSVLLAGVLLKMGTYGFVRIGLQVIPGGMRPFITMIAVLGVISIVYGAFCAMVQKDLKKLVAYSSVSHMGYVMLGIASLTAAGLNGAIMQMFSHGIITGLLFLVVGMIYERYHTREIAKLGGLFTSVSVIGGIWVFISLASFGLPMLAGFIGEFLVLVGSFPIYQVMTSLAAAAIAITAGYFLWTIRRICFGSPTAAETLLDASPRELSYLVPLMAITVVIGMYPQPLLMLMKPPVAQLLAKLGGS